MPISDLRRKTSTVINTVQESREAVYITQHGRPVAVVVDYEHYEQLLARLEDLSDQASLQAAKDEPARSYIDFMSEMGLSDTDEPSTS